MLLHAYALNEWTVKETWLVKLLFTCQNFGQSSLEPDQKRDKAKSKALK